MAESPEPGPHCFVCDKDLSQSRERNSLLLSNLTEYSRTGLPTKIGQLMGDGFMVVVTALDEACTRCYDLLNLLDKLEVDLGKVRYLLTSYLRKKYGLLETIKDEPLEAMDGNASHFDERETHNLEEEVNQVLYGKGGHLDVDCKNSLMDENSRICDILNVTLHSKQPKIMTPKPTPYKVWKCKSCEYKCKFIKDLKIHEKIHHPPAPPKIHMYGCSMCDFKAATKSELHEHSAKHVVFPKSFECEVCKISFSSQVALNEHASTHKIYQCADCGAAYEEIESLTVHQCVPQESMEANESPVICVIKVEQSDTNDSLPNVSDRMRSEDNSQSTDFGSLCQDSFREESEFSEAPDGVETVTSEQMNIFSEKPDASPTVDGKCLETQGEADEDMVNVISLFSGDDQFDMVTEGEENESADQGMGDDDEVVEDDDEEDFLNDEDNFGQNKTSNKTMNKIFVNGVEVNLADIVENEGNDMLAVDLVSSELDDQPTELKNVQGQQKVFVCTVCKFQTSDGAEIQRHLELHSFPFECDICQMKLKNQRTYDKHMQRHVNLKNPVPVLCTLCREISSDKFALRKHMLEHHPEIFKCQTCSKTFDSIRARRKHEVSHDSQPEKACDECGKSFRKLSQLNVHKEYAHRELKCQYCEKQFDTIKKLKDHERRHARDKEGFPCSQCDRVLKTASGLKLHRAKHTGQYKFCCDVCGHGFMSKAILEEHMGRHTQEKRYTCDVCGKMFVFNSTMRIHRRWHDNPLPYKCKTCGQRFRHTSLLSVHRRRMHTGERPYKCPYCALTFTVSNCLKRHVVLHTGAYPYFCEPCNKGFTTKQKMAVHLAKVHNNKEMLNMKAPPCEYKMVIPNTPVQGPPDLEDVKELDAPLEGVANMEEVQHVIIQDDDQQQLEAEGNIQLQIITMDPDHGFSVF